MKKEKKKHNYKYKLHSSLSTDEVLTLETPSSQTRQDG